LEQPVHWGTVICPRELLDHSPAPALVKASARASMASIWDGVSPSAQLPPEVDQSSATALAV
ncbi:hypothetical protein T12_13296, partial [Trichinella patagoniensis]